MQACALHETSSSITDPPSTATGTMLSTHVHCSSSGSRLQLVIHKSSLLPALGEPFAGKLYIPANDASILPVHPEHHRGLRLHYTML